MRRLRGVICIQKKALALLLVLAIGTVALCSCAMNQGGGSGRPKKYTLDDFVMDTVLSETLYSDQNYTGEVLTLLSNLEQKELSWREPASEITGVNQAFEEGEAAGTTADFAGWMEKAEDLARQSDGAFDPTIGNLIRLWNIEGENPSVPDEKEIASIIEETGWEKLKLDEGILSLAGKGTLDLGAVGKGIGADEVLKFLESKDQIQAGVIAIGGTVLTYGSKPDGSAWNVGITDPRSGDGSSMGVLSLEGTTCISTSGDYERYFEEDGIRYHHILDPQTGFPARSGLMSVTIVCESGFLSDGLSTACFVLGKDRSLPLLKHYGAEAVLIDEEKNVTVTEGLQDRLQILNEEYHLEK